jgi:cytoskeleton protein RodZ
MPEQVPAAGAGGTFGEELRREREIRGISLKEIADSTKVSKRFLEAIERNDYRNLPAPVFTRGFIREYARYLGLNADEMVTRYMHYLDSTDDPPQERPLTTANVMRIRPPAPRRSAAPAITITVIVLVALAAAGFWLFRNGFPRMTSARGVSAAHPAPAPTPPPQPATTSAPASAQPAESGQGLRLRIDCVDASWVNLMADGKTVFNGALQRGQSKTFDAAREFHFRTIGNAAGLELTLNGARLPPLGGDGEVIHDRHFDRQSIDQPSGSQTRS